MNKKLPYLMMLIVLMGCTDIQKKSSQITKPNIVLIVADDLGWADLGFTGSDLFETPNINQLAKEGVYFNNFYSASPVCSPTRASILTGKYPARLKMTTHYENSEDYWRNKGRDMTEYNTQLVQPKTVGNLPQSEITIAEYLKDQGYFTAHIGKWHLGNFEHYPENQGFDVNVGGTSWGAPDTYWYPWTGNNFQKQIRYIPGLILGADSGAYLPDRLTDKALEVIEEKKNDPFFLHLNFHIPHTPMEGKEELVDHFSKKIKPGMKDTNPVYAAMIKTMDENVGRILTGLDQSGLASNTIVIFLSDNGGRVGKFQEWETVANNSPLRSGKGSLYEGGIRVPLIIRWPGKVQEGAVCEVPLITNDLLPTIAGMVGSREIKTDGVSMMSLLQNPSANVEREMLFWHYPHYYPTTTPASAVRQGKWKLIQYFEDDRVELYDLEQDLSETEDVSKIFPDIAAEMKQSLEGWLVYVEAQLPEVNPNYHPDKKE